MTNATRDPIQMLKGYLENQKFEGATETDVPLETLSLLAARKSGGPKPRHPGGDGAAAPPVSAGPPGMDDIVKRIASCTKCELCKTRTNTVPGQGNPRPELMFIGEGPGADEDQQGLAFVGRAGQLLTKIIEAMGLTRDEVFIGNIVKCRPPNNRVPAPEEMEACLPYLHEQIALLKPRVIVCLGATAVKGLFGPDVGGITKIRGQWKSFDGIDTLPTYHPAYLLRNPAGKKDVWQDMKEVLRRLGRPVPRASK